MAFIVRGVLLLLINASLLVLLTPAVQPAGPAYSPIPVGVFLLVVLCGLLFLVGILEIARGVRKLTHES